MQRDLYNTGHICCHQDALNDYHPIAGTAIYNKVPTSSSWHKDGRLFLPCSLSHFLSLFSPPATISCFSQLKDLDPFGPIALLAYYRNNTKVSPAVIQQAALQQVYPPEQSSYMLTNRKKTNSLTIKVHVQSDPYLLHLDLSSWIIQSSVRTSPFNSSFILKHTTTERHLSVQ